MLSLLGARHSMALMVFWTARVPRAHDQEARETRAVQKNMTRRATEWRAPGKELSPC